MTKRTALALLAILIFACLIRLYHLGFPAIGYHNMKENVYISMAQNMEKSGDYWTRKVDFQEYVDIPGGQLTAWQTALCRRIFGESFLAAARGINLLFFLGAILYGFMLAFYVSGSRPVGLLTALILALLPLGNYFARNLQPEPSGFFFMLMLQFHGAQFFASRKTVDLGLCALACAGILLLKASFFLGVIPLLGLCLYSGSLRWRSLGPYFWGGLLLVGLLSWFALWKDPSTLDIFVRRVNLGRIFSGKYWADFGPAIFSYTIYENFTWYYAVTSVLGVGAILADKERPLLRGFIGGWLLMIVIYGVIFVDYINQHNYYQMPFLFLAALTSAYVLWRAATFCNDFRKDRAGSLLVIVFFLFSIPSVVASTRASYAMIFYGSDVAGNYLKNRIPEGGYFFHNGFAQSYGVCMAAEKRCGWPKDLNDFKLAERKQNVEFVSFYPFGYFLNLPQDMKEYISSHFHVAQMGFVYERAGRSFKPVSLILEKGGAVSIGEFLKGKIPRMAMTYDSPNGRVPFFVLEEAEK